jgi:hypothetical protein
MIRAMAFSYSNDVWYDDGGNSVYYFNKTGVPATEGNAIDSLLTRYTNRNVSGSEAALNGGGSTINWDGTYAKDGNAQSAVAPASAAMYMPHFRPYNNSGGSLSFSANATTGMVSKYAIYPLQSVEATAPFNVPYKMAYADKLYTSTIGLEGYNANHVPFYGFDKTFGSWTLLDENGKDITASGNAVAALKGDGLSQPYLETGAKSGKVYLKYRIAEDRYNYYNGSSNNLKVFAKNADLTANSGIVEIQVDATAGSVKNDLSKVTAKESKIKITIPDKPFTGKTVKPTAKITYNSKALTQGKDYTVTASAKNKKIGKYKAVVKALPGSALTGTTTVWYKIVPKKPGKVTVTAQKKALKVKFKTIGKAKTQGVNTYYVYYKAKNAKLWKKKKVTVKKWAKSGTLVLKKLKGGKNYQIKVAAFKKIKKGSSKGIYISKATKVYTKKPKK